MQHKVLTIAGFDSSGGAGMQADLKTFSAFACYGMSVLTALPIQNTCGVRKCYPIPLEAISDQLEAVFDDITPNAIKIGMLFNEEIIQLVASILKQRAVNIPIVLDPVMVAKSGDHLLLPSAINKLKTELMPLSAIVTPNLDEAKCLVGHEINTKEDMLATAKEILSLGANAVLIKGGHLLGVNCDDLFVNNDFRIKINNVGKNGKSKNSEEWLNGARIDSVNTHGTGCTLSAAIAACLAKGFGLSESCRIAKEYITNAILHAKTQKIGHGHGPVDHFYHFATNCLLHN